jgi:hypothetical protein
MANRPIDERELGARSNRRRACGRSERGNGPSAPRSPRWGAALAEDDARVLADSPPRALFPPAGSSYRDRGPSRHGPLRAGRASRAAWAGLRHRARAGRAGRARSRPRPRSRRSSAQTLRRTSPACSAPRPGILLLRPTCTRTRQLERWTSRLSREPVPARARRSPRRALRTRTRSRWPARRQPTPNGWSRRRGRRDRLARTKPSPPPALLLGAGE